MTKPQVTDEDVEKALATWCGEERLGSIVGGDAQYPLLRAMRRVLEQYEASRATVAPQGEPVLIDAEHSRMVRIARLARSTASPPDDVAEDMARNLLHIREEADAFLATAPPRTMRTTVHTLAGHAHAQHGTTMISATIARRSPPMSESHDIEQLARVLCRYEVAQTAGYDAQDREEIVERSWGMHMRQASAVLPLIAAAREEGAKSMQERAVSVAASWRKPSSIKLAAGEMTAQELRTAQAVAGGIESALGSLSPKEPA